MKWAWDFLVGLLTQHVATKILALLLSVVLFAFVQQRLMAEEDLGDLVLRFDVAAEYTERVVILTPMITIPAVRIRGLRTKVAQTLKDSTGREYRITIGQKFFDMYGTRRSIAINQEFCHRWNILDPDVEIQSTIPDDAALRIEQMIDLPLFLTLAEGMETNTVLSAESDYEGTLEGGKRVDVRFSLTDLRLRGPRIAFLTEPTGDPIQLGLRIGSVEAYLRDIYPLSGDGMRIDGIDWSASGIETNRVSNMQVRVRGEWVDEAAFVRALRVDFEFAARRLPLDIQPEVQLISGKPGGIDITKYRVVGPVGPIIFDERDFENRKCARFQIELPAARKNDPDLGQIVVRLDLANVEELPGEPDVLVPILLATKDPDKASVLKDVRIKIDSANAGQKPYIRFGLK